MPSSSKQNVELEDTTTTMQTPSTISKDVTILSDAPLEFSGFCPIVPLPKKRPRFARMGKGVKTYTDKQTADYENAVRKWLRNEYGDLRYPMDGSLYVKYEFILPRPKSKSKKMLWSNTKPDIDNLVKSFQDSFDFKKKVFDIQLGVISNDSRISSINATKRYAEDGERPGTKFEICSIDSRIILYSPLLSDDALKIFDKSMLTVPIPQIKELIHKNLNVKVIYLAVAKEKKEELQAIIEQIKQNFPTVKKIVINHF